jgi:hypothetical protein
MMEKAVSSRQPAESRTSAEEFKQGLQATGNAVSRAGF